MISPKIFSGSTSSSKLYSEDVFSTYVYAGNSVTNTINNGINLQDYGGLVWQKCYSADSTDHILQDSENGITSQYLSSNLTNKSAALSTAISSTSTTGYTVSSSILANQAGSSYVSWTFRKATKFFDIVKYTGDGTSVRNISHNLGVAPGCIIIKRLDSGSQWPVYHRSIPIDKKLDLNNANALANIVPSSSYWGNTTATSTVFTVGNDSDSNFIGASYVAYIFAHDTSPDGLIQCGIVENAGSNRLITNLGWEPQFLLFKDTSLTNPWRIIDTTRGWSDMELNALNPNTSNSQSLHGSTYARPDSLGVYGNDSSTDMLPSTAIYIAIRRGNKPTSTSSKVYKAITRLGNGSSTDISGFGFKLDLLISRGRGTGYQNAFFDRLRGIYSNIRANSNAIEEATTNTLTSFNFEDGIQCGIDDTRVLINSSTANYIYWAFKRYVEIFDIVCDQGSGVQTNIRHGLTVEPELIIRKNRSLAYNWLVYCKYASGTLLLNSSTSQFSDFSLWFNGTLQVNNSEFSVSSDTQINSNGDKFVSYLFATKSGVSKVGKYIGNGSSQTINCDFSSGARFILIKCINFSGDWYVWDSTRGIIALNDPHLSLNTVNVEVTTNDSVDPDSSGFIVNENTTTHINILNAEYIYLAFS